MSDVALYTNSIQTPEGTLLLINDFFIVQVIPVLKPVNQEPPHVNHFVHSYLIPSKVCLRNKRLIAYEYLKCSSQMKYFND